MANVENGPTGSRGSSSDKASVDNRANQLNPNNGAYRSSRDKASPTPATDGSVPPAGGGGTGGSTGQTNSSPK